MENAKKKILVWLSWGVDSAVTAALLINQGYDVIAGFMKNYIDENNDQCHTKEDRDMAIKVAAHLGIKTFIIFDFREEYNERIIKYIYDGYKQGITPNPDVLCNSLIKFDLFLNEAKKLWCDAVATGHYARIQKQDWYYQLLKWVDTNKDQSYFLSGLSQDQLAHALFPLGEFTKPQVRQKAIELNLPNAQRKDSQWLCFIGKVPMKEFLAKKIPIRPWVIKDRAWKTLGTHPGALFYTIGQREWIGLSWGPWFVIDKDIKNNELIVGHENDPLLWSSTVLVSDRHRSSLSYQMPLPITAKLRYRQPDQQCVMDQKWTNIVLEFSVPQRAVTPGQIAVAYQNDLLIGQWTISSSH
jgi:tRNA-uridine 2-sulfurtransferase